MSTEVPNRLGRSREVVGDHVVYRYANGLELHTEPFMKADPRRILPIGGPQDTLLNYMIHAPERIADKAVFEPFAGSGVLGLMALKLGARCVDFLDINPRATRFQVENATRNAFAPGRYRAIEGSIETFLPERPYDVILANPPFVPTPEGVRGTLTSDGGPDGNTLIQVLLARLDGLLTPEGEAFLYALQLVAGERPLIVDVLERCVEQRHVELTPTQEVRTEFDDFERAYSELFPRARSEVVQWATRLRERCGERLTLQHYAIHIQPRSGSPASWAVVDNLAEKYGQGLGYAAEMARELAYARVLENVVPSSG